MKKNNIVIVTVLFLTLAVTVFKASSAEDNKTVAWYSANIKEAQAKNKQCYADKDLQATPECVNALHALEINFGVSHK